MKLEIIIVSLIGDEIGDKIVSLIGDEIGDNHSIFNRR